ncbi:MAG: hypothetical protein ACOCV8_05210 [Spirochaetota bacterium]
MKKKLILLALIVFAFLISMQGIMAQNTSFLNETFMNNLLEEAKGLMEENENVTVEMNEIIPAEGNKLINNQPVVFELYVTIKSSVEAFFENGQYLSGIYIDNSGIYDIANGSFFDAKHYLREEPKERFLVEGTKQGRFYIIFTLSREVPYFGDFLNEPFNNQQNLGERYVNNVIEEMKDKNANVFVLELDSSNL